MRRLRSSNSWEQTPSKAPASTKHLPSMWCECEGLMGVKGHGRLVPGWSRTFCWCLTLLQTLCEKRWEKKLSVNLPPASVHSMSTFFLSFLTYNVNPCFENSNNPCKVSLSSTEADLKVEIFCAPGNDFFFLLIVEQWQTKQTTVNIQKTPTQPLHSAHLELGINLAQDLHLTVWVSFCIH